LPADVIFVLEERDHGLVTCRVFFEARDSLLEHLAKSRAHLESTKIIFWGRTIKRHRKLPLRQAQTAWKILPISLAKVMLTRRDTSAPDYAVAELG
jgi:hypothetical protein